jgi:hypothetical protein
MEDPERLCGSDQSPVVKALTRMAHATLGTKQKEAPAKSWRLFRFSKA